MGTLRILCHHQYHMRVLRHFHQCNSQELMYSEVIFKNMLRYFIHEIFHKNDSYFWWESSMTSAVSYENSHIFTLVQIRVNNVLWSHIFLISCVSLYSKCFIQTICPLDGNYLYHQHYLMIIFRHLHQWNSREVICSEVRLFLRLSVFYTVNVPEKYFSFG